MTLLKTCLKKEELELKILPRAVLGPRKAAEPLRSSHWCRMWPGGGSPEIGNPCKGPANPASAAVFSRE